MKNRVTFGIGAVLVALMAGRVDGQDLSTYRDFAMGASTAAVVGSTRVAATQLKTTHTRPALLQDLEWRPSRWTAGAAGVSTDPVDQIRFSFYDDQLYRIVVDYSAGRTAGITDADLVDALSKSYGTPMLLPAGRAVAVPIPSGNDWGTIVAQWGDASHVVVLYRSALYGAPPRLTITSSDMDALARRAATQSVQLDVADAPQREIDRNNAAEAAARDAAAKARAVNKPVFRP